MELVRGGTRDASAGNLNATSQKHHRSRLGAFQNSTPRNQGEVADASSCQGDVDRVDEDDLEFSSVYRTQHTSCVPASNKSYEEVMIEGTRSYLFANQISMTDLMRNRKWSCIVQF